MANNEVVTADGTASKTDADSSFYLRFNKIRVGKPNNSIDAVSILLSYCPQLTFKNIDVFFVKRIVPRELHY